MRLVVAANVLVAGFAQVVPDWSACWHLTRSVDMVLQDAGHPVYFVVEVTEMHIFYLNHLAKKQLVYPETTNVRILVVLVNNRCARRGGLIVVNGTLDIWETSTDISTRKRPQ
jgi:hypothetical protein